MENKANLHFKEAHKSDAIIIRDLATLAWIPTYSSILSDEQLHFMFEKWYNLNELSTIIENKSQNFILEFLGNEAVGFASYSILEVGIFKLNKIYLNPKFQGLKLGKQLLQKVERTCMEKGGHILQLNVNRYNKAKDFYLAMGYRIIAEDDIPIGEFFMNDYIMEKNLE